MPSGIAACYRLLFVTSMRDAPGMGSRPSWGFGICIHSDVGACTVNTRHGSANCSEHLHHFMSHAVGDAGSACRLYVEGSVFLGSSLITG